MKELGIGHVITAEAQRDAIHVAVAPVTATETFLPGERVGFVAPGDTERVCRSERPVGIIDPFLKGRVYAGERVWLFLFPQTITGLRHEWAHPAWEPPAPAPRADIAAAKAWVAQFAASIHQDYDSLMDAATGYAVTGRYVYDNREWYKNATPEQWGEFWQHYQTITGQAVELDYAEDCPYTCSC